MFIIKGLLDRVLFALGVLLFMQAPHFVDQYSQRLGGYYQAQLNHLEQYQKIAQTQHQGNLDLLIQEFASSDKTSVRATGRNISIVREQTKTVKSDLDVLEYKPFVFKVMHLFMSMRYEIAQQTFVNYKPGVPFSIEAFVCALLGGVLMSSLFNSFLFVPRLFKRKPNKISRPVEKRIEPKVNRVARAS
ncbi:MAG: DUF2937 family protein [Gammaproteobacteria bacterium]|nr:DUF2937 family protein [Gammaproteobacteria bacterium]